jgi:monoamine oxidase
MGSYMIEADKNEFEPKKWASDNPNGFPKRSMETHLNVLVVGGGLAGLMTALECWRKGHNVINILERQNGPVHTGKCVCVCVCVCVCEILQILLKTEWRLTTPSLGDFRRHHHHRPFGHQYFPPLAGHVAGTR